MSNSPTSHSREFMTDIDDAICTPDDPCRDCDDCTNRKDYFEVISFCRESIEDTIAPLFNITYDGYGDVDQVQATIQHLVDADKLLRKIEGTYLDEN